MKFRFKRTPDDHEHSRFVREAAELYQAPLLRYATRLLDDPERARDVVQETFLRLFTHKGEDVRDHLAEWLYTVCRNRAFDVKRKERRMRTFSEGEAERMENPAPRPGAIMETEENLQSLLVLIDRLPPNQREVVRLKFQSGFSYKEISRITSLSVTNVGFLLHTAIKKLKSEWSQTKA